MLIKIKIVIAAALVLGTAFSASAATRSRASQAYQPATGGKYGPSCTASGGPQCNTGCQATGAPCKEGYDGW
jgi:hypothetical protein